MARLVSYKVKDDNRYSTFKNENRWNSNENLTIQNEFQFVTKTSEKKICGPSKNDQKLLCQCQCWIKCWQMLCCRCCCSDSQGTDDEIDKNFSRYTNEMQSQDIEEKVQSASEKVSALKAVVPVEEKKKKSAWNWNDSLRSNSDKFLETLEYDLDDRSLKRRYKHRPIRFATANFMRRGTVIIYIIFDKFYFVYI